MSAPVENEKEHKVGYVGARISVKSAKIALAHTPKHGAIKRETMKFYMGLRKTAPGEPRPEKK